MLEALEDLHSIGYLHRDVKPENYTIGRREKDDHKNIYLLDFGMARKFINAEVGSLAQLGGGCSLISSRLVVSTSLGAHPQTAREGWLPRDSALRLAQHPPR
jgi:serine/threonine protein kinase